MKVTARGIVAVVLLALCLAACGGGGGGSGSNGGGSGGAGTAGGESGGTGGGGTGDNTGGGSGGGGDNTGGGGGGDNTGGGGGGGTAAVRASYQVPQASCLGDFHVPLVVTTDTEAEIAYLNKIPACTTDSQNSTFLRNNSDAVWVLHNKGPVDGTVTPWNENATMTSFRSIVPAGPTLLIPGGAVIVNLPPSALEWDLDLPLTVGWVAHSVVTAKIENLFKTARNAAIKRSSPAGAAVVACTSAVTDYAKSVQSLADQQLSQIVMDGLGFGKSFNNCRQELMKVAARDANSEQAIVLSDEIAKVGRQTEVLEGIDRYLTFAKQGSRFEDLAIYFISHH